MTWQATVDKTVTGLGYELVDCERSAAGLLRVTIDKLPEQALAGEVINVDDCERVTRQLQYVLEVEAVPYQRLEVSSPGLDRPLNKASDYERFVGSPVQVTLKVAFQGRKKYKGELSREGEGWRVIFADDHGVEQALDFTLEEVREAHLVPVYDFKGRGAKAAPGAKTPAGKTPAAKTKKPSKRSNAKARQAVEDTAADTDDKVEERS
ncbi:MAG: ribosome maturation factor RimP [Paucibacter sp.]|nr:ribosome maturation factor RimP [Roseateles sp.]